MYATTSFAATFAGASSDTGYVLGIVIAATVAGIVALMGLGYGMRHIKRILGRKF